MPRVDVWRDTFPEPPAKRERMCVCSTESLYYIKIFPSSRLRNLCALERVSSKNPNLNLYGNRPLKRLVHGVNVSRSTIQNN
jgi:hypothetical protein